MGKAITEHEPVREHGGATHTLLEPIPTFFAPWPHHFPMGVPHKQLYPFIFASAWELISGEMKRVKLAPGCSRETLVEPEGQTLL